MSSETIHVRRLRLAAPQRIASATLGARVGDALRCASLPAGWRGRIVLIRRLRLRADARSSPQQLARQIESQWQAAAVQAVPAARATAGSDAVWFDDEPAARLLLIARLARGGDVSAWYWRRLLPPGDLAANDAAIAAVLAAPWQSAAGAAGRPRFAADAFRAIGDIDLIARVLNRSDDAALEHFLPGLAEAARDEADDGSAPAPRGPGQPHREASSSRTPRRAGFAPTENASPRRNAATRFAIAVLAGERREHAAGSSTSDSRAQASAKRASAVDPELRFHTSTTSATLSAPGLPTEWGGWFFVLNLWQQARYAPASGAEALDGLRTLAQQLRVADDDGLWPTLMALEPPSQVVSMPLPWAAMRRACLAATRLPLRRVLKRPGRIDLTRTHLTVLLPLRAVNLRIRRAGLDLDPGWSPWLGRVVRFEYD